jgi:hypothetical protein
MQLLYITVLKCIYIICLVGNCVNRIRHTAVGLVPVQRYGTQRYLITHAAFIMCCTFFLSLVSEKFNGHGYSTKIIN